MNQSNWERAEALMEDIEYLNPKYARQLLKKKGKKGMIRYLKEFLDTNDRHYQQMKETILEQMPKANDPFQRMVQEAQAHEIAQEMAYEEVQKLYTPRPSTWVTKAYSAAGSHGPLPSRR